MTPACTAQHNTRHQPACQPRRSRWSRRTKGPTTAALYPGSFRLAAAPSSAAARRGHPAARAESCVATWSIFISSPSARLPSTTRFAATSLPSRPATLGSTSSPGWRSSRPSRPPRLPSTTSRLLPTTPHSLTTFSTSFSPTSPTSRRPPTRPGPTSGTMTGKWRWTERAGAALLWVGECGGPGHLSYIFFVLCWGNSRLS
ncbi:hypothetical protein DFJ74DRAFT_683760 [Hyaloraphidium curvatum]|nr:hypothetical protein DFJ74DRAFT_683760 [Hyaloraphidium curvatum]